MTLEGTYHRLELIQSSRSVKDTVSPDGVLRIFKGLTARIDCALFLGPDAEDDTMVSSTDNLVSARFTVRKKDVYGTALIDKTITSFGNVSFANWANLTASQFSFDLSEIDTNQSLPSSIPLPVYYAVTLSSASRTFIAGSGTGEIVESGVVGVSTPLPATLPSTTVGGNLVINGTFASTGPVTAPSIHAAVYDTGGQVFNVKAFGAIGDGDADDLAAFEATVAALPATGGTMFIPVGTYRFTAPWIIDGSQKTISIEGAGRRSTIIVGDHAGTVIQLGVPNELQYVGKISHLGVTRDNGGVIPSGSIGVSAAHTNQVALEDVVIGQNDIGLKTNDGWTNTSIGLVMNQVYIYSCHYYVWLKTAAEVMVHQCVFGAGGETVPLTSAFVFEGDTNDVRIQTCQFLPQGGGTRNAFHWKTSDVENTGYYRFNDINLELIVTAFTSESGTTAINDLQVTNSRITPTGKLFDFHANTLISGLNFVNNGSVSFGTPSSIVNGGGCRFINNTVSGTLTFNGGSWTVSKNVFTTISHYSGVFNPLILTDNQLIFDGSFEITLHVTGTGKIVMDNNVADAGTQPPVVLLSDITQRSWIAPNLLNSWVNYGGSDAEVSGYRKESTGVVRLKGLIKDGTNGAGTVLFVLPAGYRPLKQKRMVGLTENVLQGIYINADGSVGLIGNALSNVSLDGITFSST